MSENTDNKMPELNQQAKQTSDIKNKNLPSIYYNIPNSYPANKTLKIFFNYDNTPFSNWLKQQGFTIYDNTKSNYLCTGLSLSPTLNMDYFENIFDYSPEYNNNINAFKLNKATYNSKTAQLLQKLDYKYYHIINHWENEHVAQELDKTDVKINVVRSNEFDKIFLKQATMPSLSHEISKKFIKLSRI